MKIVKKLIKIALWLVGIVVVLVLALPLWIGPAVKTAANVVVPKKTGTSFNLGAFALNPYTGKLAVGDVQLFNPEGFDQRMAVTLGSLDVDVDVASLAGDPIVVREIALKDVFVSYVMNGKGENNFTIIKNNATGGAAEPAADAKKPEAQKPEAEPSVGEKPAKKVIIDHLLIQNVKVQLGPITIPQPINFELTGLGRKSNGMTMEEAWNQIYAQIVQNFNALGVNLDGLVNSIGNAGLEQAIKAIGAAGDLTNKEGQRKAVKNLVDAFAGGSDIVGGAASQTTEAVGKGTGKAVGAVGQGAGKAVDAVSEGTKKTVDAVNEQTGKAVNALKGLFN